MIRVSSGLPMAFRRVSAGRVRLGSIDANQAGAPPERVCAGENTSDVVDEISKKLDQLEGELGPFTDDSEDFVDARSDADAARAPVQTSQRDQQPPAGFMPFDFNCPIGGDIMEDPVVAEDGRSYSRELIEMWFEQCRSQDQEITSPITRAPMGDTLTENISLRGAIEELQAHRRSDAAEAPSPAPVPSCSAEEIEAARQRAQRFASLPPGAADIKYGVPADVATVHELGEIFAHLDPLRELFGQCLDGWQPPQVVVVGNENSGKSTILERLCMMTIFPHAETLCTRMRIQVRLRRGALTAPRLEVFNHIEGRTEGSPIIVPIESAVIDVREAMERLIRERNQGLVGVTTSHSLILHVRSPNIPTLDLVDLPGVVVCAADGEPEDMPQQTKRLVDEHIDQHGAHSVFLAIVDATTAPNSAAGMQILREKGMLDKTVGVITKCDELCTKQQKTKLLNRLAQTGDAVVLEPYGYVATMNAPIDEEEDEGSTNMQKLQLQARKEPAWFAAEGYQDLVNKGNATTQHLLSRVNTMFLRYVKDSWMPDTMQKLRDQHDELQKQNAELGLPPAYGTGTRDSPELATLREAAHTAVQGALDVGMPSILAHFSEFLAKDLCTALKQSKLPHNGTDEQWMEASPIPIEDCSIFLADMKKDVVRVCKEAEVTGDNVLIETLRSVLEGPQLDDSFKLKRFPTLVERMINELRTLLDICSGGLSAVIGNENAGIINQFLGKLSATVRIKHSVHDLTSTISVDTDKIIGAVVQLYAENRLYAIKVELPDKIRAVVHAALDENTQDACHAERLELLEQMANIEKAQQGIRAVALKAVSFAIQHWTRTQLAIPVCLP